MATEIRTWQIVEGRLSDLDESMVDAGRWEKNLEEWIKTRPEIIGEGIRIIGEQVPTRSGPLDFLGIDGSGNLVVVELKRGRIPRAQSEQARALMKEFFFSGKPPAPPGEREKDELQVAWSWLERNSDRANAFDVDLAGGLDPGEVRPPSSAPRQDLGQAHRSASAERGIHTAICLVSNERSRTRRQDPAVRLEGE